MEMDRIYFILPSSICLLLVHDHWRLNVSLEELPDVATDNIKHHLTSSSCGVADTI